MIDIIDNVYFIFIGSEDVDRYRLCLRHDVAALPCTGRVQFIRKSDIYGSLVFTLLSHNGLHQQCHQPNTV